MPSSSPSSSYQYSRDPRVIDHAGTWADKDQQAKPAVQQPELPKKQKKKNNSSSSKKTK
ncbi:hypothetical protein SMMN14_08513 [Sphaerulina musiva]